jgi:leader peptidase (prepilin peptidase) / N-methyltransferase
MDVGIVAVCAVGGLVMGDALEVVVERIPERASLAAPWNTCADCGAAGVGLRRWPIVSTLAGGANCPNCGSSRAHRWRPLVLAVATAVVLGAFAVHFGPDPALAAFAFLGIGLVAITAVDLERQLVPVRLLYPTLGVVSPLLVVAGFADHRSSAILHALAAGVGAFLIFLLIHLVQPRGMGFGDVRLSGLVGGATGWLGTGWRGGLGHMAVTLFSAFLLGAIVGVGLIALKGYGGKARLPFAPFLAAGAVVSVLWGSPVVHAWLGRA